jgi:hypothetical protein
MTTTLPATLIIPVISGRTRGPLGIGHLPRLWLKLRLGALGRLPEGYRCGEGGTDGELLGLLGLDVDAVRTYVGAEHPDELTFEAWVRERATAVAGPEIDEFNASLESFQMPSPRREQWVERFGLTGYTVATRLNELDDWDLAHQAVLAGNVPTPLVIPAISSSIAGPFEVAHLPRFWFKKILKHHGRLPAEYRCGEGGFDGTLLDVLGIANDDVDAFVASEKPGYLKFEAWVRERTTSTPAARDAVSEKFRTTIMPDALAVPRRAQYGLPDSITNGPLLNDVDDWGGIHTQLRALA